VSVLAAPTRTDFAARVREREAAWLSPLATRSYPARRRREEPDCALRTPFQRDRDRIVHAKAFRRLKHKTQVFVAPEGDHYRTRLTHTLEVTQISRTVARALELNEDLVEAIGLGHDLGHPPFGHIGEAVLDRCLTERFPDHGGFRHWEHSLRVVDLLEAHGAADVPGVAVDPANPPRGLNLTDPVRDGIAHHSGRAEPPATLEGAIVRLVDRVAYLNHDIDDALRAGIIAPRDLPARELGILGQSGPQRIDTLVHDLVEQSHQGAAIVQGEAVGAAMDRLRDFMFECVYTGPAARAEHARIETVVSTLFEHFCQHPEELPTGAVAQAPLAQRVTDYLAGMTDRFCVRAFEHLAVPRSFAR